MPRQSKTASQKSRKRTSQTESASQKRRKSTSQMDGDVRTEIPCPACNGKGKHDCPECCGAKKMDCVDCNGSGKVDCPVCNEGYVTKSRYKKCEHCEGLGYVYLSDGITSRSCYECSGEGEIKIDYEELCPNCHGDYKGYKKCPTCNGKKKVDCEFCSGNGKAMCPICNGTGLSTIESICTAISRLLEENNHAEKILNEVWFEEFLPVLNDAAARDVGIAMYALGLLYFGTDDDGSFCDVITQDDEKAEFWIHRAAEYGIGDAQLLYGKILEFGECGVEKDLKGAVEWYKKAADQGVEFAVRYLERDELKKVTDEVDDKLSPPRLQERTTESNHCRRKHWLFVLSGIFFGLFGLQFVYARRWRFFFAHWAALVAAIIWEPQIFAFCVALWLGSIFLMSADRNGPKRYCIECGSLFIPHSSTQETCDGCKARN